jgi:deleted-in-malignant-brain-tumors protein 1
MDNSEVVCRELGYNGTVAISYNYYSTSGTVETMDYVECSGSEYQLSDCDYDVHVAEIVNVPGTECAYYGCYYGEIRLVGGESEREGRLEVCNNGRWGSVCGTQWTNRHTAVVCRYFGFSDLPTDLTYYSAEKYGKGSGPVFMDFVNCTGNEWRLWGRCTYWTHYYGCSHDDDIGVQCAPARCSDGQLRLAEGSDSYYGRVEICSDQRWNTLSSARSLWSYTNARIACIELGFQYYNYAYDSYGNSGGPRYSKYFRCTGQELRLSQCPSYNDTYTRSYSYDIGVRCRLDNCVNGQIRLMEGEDQLEGRLEVCYSGRWGNVGGDEWTKTNSRVVCNSLGYDFSDESTNLSIPTAPSKPLYYHSVKCSRRDLSLEECGFTKYTDLTKTYPHTVVKCQESQCKDGDLKLVGGATESEGRLEVCFGKRWGTIDGHGWTHTDTQVACRQLGHSTEDVSYTKHQRTRISIFLPTFMTLVGCYGSEDKLTDCSYHESSSSTSMDISISCDRKNDSTDSTTPPSSTDSQIDNNDDGTGSSGMVYASLSVSALLAVVVIALVAVLIVVFLLWRRKKSRGSSSGIHFSNKNETVSLDNKLAGKDLPTESCEQMKATNRIPLPPRSQLRQAPSDNASTMSPQKADWSRYAQSGGNSRADAGPKTLPNVLPRRGRPRPPAEEDIYECPD